MNREDLLKDVKRYSGVTTMEAGAEFKPTIMGGVEMLTFGDRIVTPSALETAAMWVGAPKRFLSEACPTDLRATILNRLMPMQPNPRVICKESEVLSFSNDKYSMIDPERLIPTIEKKFPISIFDRVYANGGQIELYVVGEKEHAVVVGDVVRGGAYMTFSPYGDFQPEVVSYVMRLACTNGAVRQSDLTHYKHGYGDPYEWLANTVEIASGAAESEVEKYRKMREQRLDGNTTGILRHILSNIPKKYHDIITNAVITEKPETVYDLMNIVTRIASHSIQDPRQVFNMMAAGGDLPDHLELCPTCYRPFEN